MCFGKPSINYRMEVGLLPIEYYAKQENIKWQ